MSDEAERLAEEIRNNEALQNEATSQTQKDNLSNQYHGLQIAIQTEIANQTGETFDPGTNKS